MAITDEPPEPLHTLLSFRASDNPAGLTIVDHVERRRCTLRTTSEVDPQEIPVGEFYFPVDRGVAVTTDQLSLPHTVAVCIRNHAGFMVEELTEGEARELPRDLYSLEITAPIKLYLVFEDTFSIEVTTDEVVIEFEEEIEIFVGARSHHENPAAEITTSEDPHDLMKAISYFGSALKTTSPERSYPTLRGHPPTIELGGKLDIPSVLEKPGTGVSLVLPPEYRSVYVASSLAYYLGATIEPGEPPRIETEHGFVHHLDHPERGFENEVERVLKQTFFLDCVTRTEGYYPVELHERNQIQSEVDLNFEELYTRSLSEQLQRYLDVSYSIVRPHLPQWKLTAHTMLVPEHAEMLPFLAKDLAVIRSADEPSIEPPPSEVPPLNESARKGDFVRRTKRANSDPAATPSLIKLDEVDSLEQTWIGDGAPIGASKAMIEAFRNRLERTPTDGDIDITIVCNDGSMEDERNIVDEVYGSRDELPFDVTIHRELTKEELADVLMTEMDFFHYIGHIDDGGFECTDGRFDSATLPQTGVDVFFLNACSSYKQGMNLIQAGGIAGIVTLQDVINSGAERVGKMLAKLLNRGFPVHVALNIAKNESIMGGHYLVIGDGSLDITQPEIGVPVLADIGMDGSDNNEIPLRYMTFPTSVRGMGTLTIPYVGRNEEYFITSGETGEFLINEEQLEKFLSSEVMPIKIDNRITWSDNLEVSDLV